jgi:hypothetical protein
LAPHIFQDTATFDGPIWFGTATFGGIEATAANNGGTLYSWDELRGIQVIHYFENSVNSKPIGSLIDDPVNSGFNQLFGMGERGPYSFNLQQYYQEPIPPIFSQPIPNNSFFRSVSPAFFNSTGLYGSSLLGGLSIGPSSKPERLYGTSQLGGIANKGLIWSVDSGDISNHGNYNKEATFTGLNGANPQFAPFQGPSGFIYGDVQLGSTFGVGALYKLDPIGSTGQIWYYNFNSTNLSGLTGSGTIFSTFDGNAEYVSISARKSNSFYQTGNTIVALANYSSALLGNFGPNAGPWIYGSVFTNSTTLSTTYQPMGPTFPFVGATTGGYFETLNRVKNFPWLGSTANPDYYKFWGRDMFNDV